MAVTVLWWLAVVKSSFLPNVVEEIRHGCKHLQMSLINNSKFVWNIPGWDAIENRLSVWTVDLKIWVRGRKIVIGKMLDTIYNIKAVRRKSSRNSLSVGLEPSVLYISAIETSSRKSVCASRSKSLYKSSCMHFSPLLKLLLLDL